MIDKPRALFELGHMVATPGALAALNEASQGPFVFLSRHILGRNYGSSPRPTDRAPAFFCRVNTNMRYLTPEQRRLANYRGVPGVQNATDLRRCLFAQMTDRDYARFMRTVHICLGVTGLCFAAGAVWAFQCGAPVGWAAVIGAFLAALPCGLVFPDPIKGAMREFRAELYCRLQQQSELQRTQREEQGL